LASSTAEAAGPKPVFVITGTSGEGKSTLARALLHRVPELELAVSATTRARRPGEVDGRDYWFITRDEFDRRLASDEFLEYVEWPWGEHNRAGTLWSEIDRIANRGKAVLLELETGGALAVQQRVPNAVTIFVTAPNPEELERRLRTRGTESPGEIEQRLATAREQRALAPEFRHRVVNDDLERALDELEGIVRGELHASSAGGVAGTSAGS
jgi:guanylate kinase